MPSETEIKWDTSAADNVNLLGDNTDIIRNNTETVVYALNEFVLKVNAEKTKYILPSRHQNAGQNHKIEANKSFENETKFRYFGRTVTNQYLIQEEIKRSLNSGNT
jgi:hypothetical protein